MWEIAWTNEGRPVVLVMRLSNAIRTLINSSGYVSVTDVMPWKIHVNEAGKDVTGRIHTC